MSKKAIRKFAEELEIPALVHFTPISNLANILEKGLLCRDDVGVDAQLNDEMRLDGRLNRISTSIAFPNSSMFYKCRQEKQGQWAVLALSKRILWKLDCLFCKHNAADVRITACDEEELSTLQAFKSMYEEHETVPSRKDQRLRKYDPTDVQAEVLVKDFIPPKYILGVVFPDTPSKEKHAHLTLKRKVFEHSRNKGFFASRGYVRR